MRFTSFVRLTGRTGWKRRFSAHLPLSSAKLLNWNWIDQRLVTGLATCLASSFEEIFCGAEACGHAGVATPRSSAATPTARKIIGLSLLPTGNAECEICKQNIKTKLYLLGCASRLERRYCSGRRLHD